MHTAKFFQGMNNSIQGMNDELYLGLNKNTTPCMMIFLNGVQIKNVLHQFSKASFSVTGIQWAARACKGVFLCLCVHIGRHASIILSVMASNCETDADPDTRVLTQHWLNQSHYYCNHHNYSVLLSSLPAIIQGIFFSVSRSFCLGL